MLETEDGPHTVECSTNEVTIVAFYPEVVDLIISWDGGGFVKRYTPRYFTVESKGLDCPSVCQVGVVVVEIP